MKTFDIKVREDGKIDVMGVDPNTFQKLLIALQDTSPEISHVRGKKHYRGIQLTCQREACKQRFTAKRRDAKFCSRECGFLSYEESGKRVENIKKLQNNSKKGTVLIEGARK